MARGCSLEIADVQFGVYAKAMHVLHLNLSSSFFLISLCLMQANSFAVPFSFTIFGQEVASSSLKGGTISLVCCICKKLMHRASKQSGPIHCSKQPGICFEPWQFPVTFHQVLDTYQQTSEVLAREVLHEIFFMSRGDRDIPKAIAGRVNCLHQMIGL